MEILKTNPFFCLMNRKRIFVFMFMFISLSNVAQNNDDKKGFFNLTRVGYHNITSIERSVATPGFGTTATDLPTNGSYVGSLNNITGYFITNRLSLGLGIGLDGMHNPDLNALPVFLDVRGYLAKSDNSLYSYLNVGPNINPRIKNAVFQTGVTVNFGIGYQVEFFEQLFQIDLAYNAKNLIAPVGSERNPEVSTRTNAFSLNIGIIFF